jgi:transposase
VASKLTTVSAQDMIKAMIAGQRDPRVLAALARTKMKAKHDELVQALDGMFDDHHGELAQLLLDQIAGLDGKITQLGTRIGESVAALPAAWGVNPDGTTGPEAGTGPDATVIPAVTRLAEIPGVSENLALAIIAQTGLDMTRFPTAGHLVSWAGVCPSARQPGPRTCWLTPPPGSTTSATAITRTAPTRTASSATTSGRSRRCWATPSPSPRPANPIPSLIRPDHHTRPGSAAACPFPGGLFSGQQRVTYASSAALDPYSWAR